MTKSDITDYISPSQLLPMFGGTDEWTFDAEAFKEELRKEHDSIWLSDPLGAPPQEEKEEEEEEEEEEEKEEEEEEEEEVKETEPNARQVIKMEEERLYMYM